MIINFSYKEKEIYVDHKKRLGKIRWNTHIGAREESDFHWENDTRPLFKNYTYTIVEKQIHKGKEYYLLKSKEMYNGHHCFIVIRKEGIKK